MARGALYSASVLSSAANGRRLPTLSVTLAYVGACGGDPDEWRHRWSAARQAETGPARSIVRPRPAPASPLPHPAQLPWRSWAFTGWAGELRQLTEGGSTAGPVVISGPAGVGKSELALVYANRLARDMPDGQLYADLGKAPAEPDAVVDGFLYALGVPVQQLPAAADQRIGLYRSLLAQRRVLVLLDNACCERQVRPLLAESRLSVTILVSRAPLLGLSGVRRVRLNVLSRCDSIAHINRLLPRRARQDPVACDQLAALCADLPLALDIATRKLAARPELPLRRVVDWLREPHAALDWLRLGDLSVGDMLDAVYGQLDDAAQALLIRLARRNGDRPTPSPGQGLIVAPPGEEDHYEQLAEAGMLRWGTSPGTYRVDPLVRAFVSVLVRQPTAMHRRVPVPRAPSRPARRCSRIDCRTPH
jgi:hypothetical protein